VSKKTIASDKHGKTRSQGKRGDDAGRREGQAPRLCGRAQAVFGIENARQDAELSKTPERGD